MFHVEYDRDSNRLRIHVKGFWKPEHVALLAREVGVKALEASKIRNDFNVIVESFEFPVQANSVADMLAEIMRGGMTLTSGKAAVVVGSQLNKAQAERTLLHPRVRVFQTLQDGEQWLQEPLSDPSGR